LADEKQRKGNSELALELPAETSKDGSRSGRLPFVTGGEHMAARQPVLTKVHVNHELEWYRVR